MKTEYEKMRSEEFFASKAAEPSAMTSRAKNVWQVTSRPSISVRSCKPCSTVTDTRGQAVCRFLGDISYPLYVTHYPLIYFQMSFAASTLVVGDIAVDILMGARAVYRIGLESLYVDAIGLFHLAHDESALYGGETLNLAQFVEHKGLILLHIACAYL